VGDIPKMWGQILLPHSKPLVLRMCPPWPYHHMEVKQSVWFVTQRNVLRARHSPIKLPKEKGWEAQLAALPISLRGSQSASFPSPISMISQNLNNIG